MLKQVNGQKLQSKTFQLQQVFVKLGFIARLQEMLGRTLILFHW
ncbi:hypothetical protein HMPREF1370_01455 [Enterococcus faecium P1123]|nr:hypothetical protein HMPREF1370_01455 [Enterococcus faecium P1123]